MISQQTKNHSVFAKEFGPRELIENQKYNIRFLSWDSRKYFPCIFKKVTEKGFAFVRRKDESKIRKRLLYPSKYWEKRLEKVNENALWFNIHRSLIIEKV